MSACHHTSRVVRIIPLHAPSVAWWRTLASMSNSLQHCWRLISLLWLNSCCWIFHKAEVKAGSLHKSSRTILSWSPRALSRSPVHALPSHGDTLKLCEVRSCQKCPHFQAVVAVTWREWAIDVKTQPPCLPTPPFLGFWLICVSSAARADWFDCEEAPYHVR